MTKFRFLLIFILSSLLLQTGRSQDNDFGIWYGLNIEYSFNKKLEFDVSAMARTFNNAKKLEQSFIEGEVTYKFNKNLSVAGTYRFTEKIEDNAGFYPRHKLFSDIKLTLPTGNFTFSSRIRFQYQKKTYIEKLSDKEPDFHGRMKFKVVYKIPGLPLYPFIYNEFFSPIFSNSDRFIDKEWFGAGFDLKITQIQSVELEYIFQRDFKPHISDINIVSINYCFKF